LASNLATKSSWRLARGLGRVASMGVLPETSFIPVTSSDF
jgi:hypothetical protein